MIYFLINENGTCGGNVGTEPFHKNWTTVPYIGGLVKEFFNGTKWIETATPEEIQKFTNARVPQTLTPRQFWLSVFTLKAMKKQDALDFIETLPEPPREVAKITLLESLQFERNDAMLINFSHQFGWDDNDLNDIFTFGETL